MSDKAKSRKQTAIILAIIAVILLTGVIFVANTMQSQSPTRMVNVPDVQTHVVSEDGSAHLFGARVVLEVDRSTSSVNNNALYNEVRSALSSLSYEEISGANGMTLAREAVEGRLAATFGEGELVGVMFRDFLTGVPLPAAPRGGGGGGNNLFRELITGGSGD